MYDSVGREGYSVIQLCNFKRLGALTFMFALATGCGGDDGDKSEDDANSGKADDADGDSERACGLEPSEERRFVQFVNNDTVQFRCRGANGQFVESGCCAEEIDEFVFATGCPTQAKFSTAAGDKKRCIEDTPDASEQIDGEFLVSTMCCSLLCDPGARWDDGDRTTCRNSMGQFHPHACCQMNDDARCGAAAFDSQPDSNGFVHCRAQEGDFAGQFAPAACCLDECTDLVERGEDVLPLECLLPLEEECLGAAVDANGFCRAEDGRFAKAACCQGLADEDDLDVQGSDDCRVTELYGDDLQAAGCV